MPKPQITGEDQFVTTSLALLDWARQNSRALVLGAAALAIVAFGVRYYLDYQRRVEEVASTQLRALRSQLELGSAADVIDQLRGYLAQFGSTAYAQEARVLLAHSLLLQNRAAEAIEPARQAVEKLGTDVLSTRAAFLLAAAYEEVGDTALAISVYEDAGAKLKGRVQRTRALEGAARLRAARGERAGAAAIYEQLAELSPEDGPARLFYEMRAAELRAGGARVKVSEGS